MIVHVCSSLPESNHNVELVLKGVSYSTSSHGHVEHCRNAIHWGCHRSAGLYYGAGYIETAFGCFMLLALWRGGGNSFKVYPHSPRSNFLNSPTV